MSLRIAALIVVLALSTGFHISAVQDELRKGESGSGDIITNQTKSIARRRTRPAKAKSASVAATPNSASDYVTQSSELFDKGNYEAAVKTLEQAIRVDPQYEQAYYALSDAYLKLNNENKSLEVEQQGLQIARSKRRLISGGFMNSKALNFQVPEKPPIARVARTAGKVTVAVFVGEDGNVISARAVEGHPLLRSAAVQAAISVKFEPLNVSGVPVKVVGILEYEFN